MQSTWQPAVAASVSRDERFFREEPGLHFPYVPRFPEVFDSLNPTDRGGVSMMEGKVRADAREEPGPITRRPMFLAKEVWNWFATCIGREPRVACWFRA